MHSYNNENKKGKGERFVAQMGRDPFAQVGVDGHQFNSQPNTDQKAAQDDPFGAVLESHQQ